MTKIMDSGRLSPAEMLLKNLGVATPQDIQLRAICAAFDIRLNFMPLQAMEARIITRRDSKGHSLITINNRPPRERQRFSIGHELGHWYHHKGISHQCIADDIDVTDNAKVRKANTRERVADKFAADLLMPAFMFTPKVRPMRRVTCALLQELAEEFRVSLHAVARRCAEINTHPMMIVLTGRDRKCRLLARSNDMEDTYWPHRLLSKGTMACNIFENGASPLSDTVPTDEWFDSEASLSGFVFEDSMKYRDGVLSILTIEG